MKEGDVYGTKTRQTVRHKGQTMSPEASENRLLSLFLTERDRLRRIAAGMGMSRTDADDVLQDVSIQVIRYEGMFDEDGTMLRWLIRTTVNQCMTEHRKRFCRRTSRILERRPDVAKHLTDGRDVTEHIGLTEEFELVRQTLQELDPSLLSIVVLRYFCDMTSSEIAKIMEWSASTVRSRLREARMILASKLVQRGLEP